MSESPGHRLEDALLAMPGLLPAGSAGVDAGLTLTKTAVAVADGVQLRVRQAGALPHLDGAASLGVTGARAGGAPPGAVAVPEIEGAERGVRALMPAGAREGTFVLALIGTGTAFALVRDGSVTHLGGTALGGGSFCGIARRLYPSLKYAGLIERAERGERRNVDTMVSDAYPDGIGRIGPDLTAAHLAGPDGSAEDVLAALLNMHGENIAQIAASRALVAQAPRVVLAGGFVHNNPALVESLRSMIGRFRIAAELAPAPGFAGAIGAALIAAEARQSIEEKA